jgi:hypothetical protein
MVRLLQKMWLSNKRFLILIEKGVVYDSPFLFGITSTIKKQGEEVYYLILVQYFA